MGDKVAASLGQVGRRASEVAALASSIANPYTRRVAEAIASATNKDGGGGDGGGGKGGGKGGGRRGGGDDDGNGNGNGGVSTPFGFLDSMCGPVLRNLNGQGGGGTDDDGDLVALLCLRLDTVADASYSLEAVDGGAAELHDDAGHGHPNCRGFAARLAG